MKKSFTHHHTINLTNHFHTRLQADISRMLEKTCFNASPGSMALRNVLAFAAAYEVFPTKSAGKQEILVN